MKIKMEPVSIEALEALKQKFEFILFDIKKQIAWRKCQDGKQKRKIVAEARRAIVNRVLCGEESIAGVAFALGVSPAALRSKIHSVCEKKNPTLYRAGIQNGKSNNYRTPSINYLQKNRAGFGF